MSENGAVVLAAIITALGAVVAALITVRNKKSKKEESKIVVKNEKKCIIIPLEPDDDINPFDLDISEQEFGSEEYFEAIGTQLMVNRKGEDLYIKKIN